MTSCFHTMGSMGQNRARRCLEDVRQVAVPVGRRDNYRMRHGGGKVCCLWLTCFNCCDRNELFKITGCYECWRNGATWRRDFYRPLTILTGIEQRRCRWLKVNFRVISALLSKICATNVTYTRQRFLYTLVRERCRVTTNSINQISSILRLENAYHFIFQ